MHIHADNTQKNSSRSAADALSKKQDGGEPGFQFEDNRPEAIAQRKRQEMANNSSQATKYAQFQAADQFTSQHSLPIQKKANNTGLPDNLKSGIENLSGYSLHDTCCAAKTRAGETYSTNEGCRKY